MPKRSRAPQRQTISSNTYRFFVETGALPGREVEIDDTELAHQLGTVLRLRPGERVVLLDNSGWQFTLQLSAIERGRVAGTVELIEAGVTGLLVEPAEPRQLADAIAGLLDDPDRRRAMGKAATLRYEATYTPAQAVAAYRDLTDRLLTGVTA